VKRGFTLIEIVVVMAIIVVLASLLLPVFTSSKQAAYKTAALTQMRQLGIASTLYQGEWDDKLVPSTNYGYADPEPEKIWTNLLFPYVKDRKIFIAPSTFGQFVFEFRNRGWASIGMNLTTAIDLRRGCRERQEDKSGCQAFRSPAELEKSEAPSRVALFAITPSGDTEMNYRGYEFSPYNGIPRNIGNIAEWPPLVSEKDLVEELFTVPGDFLKPIQAVYSPDGQGNGSTPVVFADGHVKPYTANQIERGSTTILWRLR
jgi:prepilin-type N-terminal cleavage/methylation domain-containing protein/prepilin-type processing-associated H-X9-DG protein